MLDVYPYRISRSRPLTEALPASGEGRDSNPRRRESGVTTFKKKAAALGHSATSPILRILYSPNVVEGEFSEVRLSSVLGQSHSLRSLLPTPGKMFAKQEKCRKRRQRPQLQSYRLSVMMWVCTRIRALARRANPL